MKKTLFILTKPINERTEEIVSFHKEGTIVLMQDAIKSSHSWGLPVFVEKEDANERGLISIHPEIHMNQVLSLIETHDRVIVF
jgi:sulfur transfer complex TusBCD TusB component (DsrH family)